MADNFEVLDGNGTIFTAGSVEAGGVHYPKTVLADETGATITKGQKTMSNSIPVVLPSDQTGIPFTIADGGDVTFGAKADTVALSDTGTYTFMALFKRLLSVTIGSITETAPATDTASSGVNGRLQRVAQRITTVIGYLTNIDTYTQSNNNLLSTIDADTGTISTNSSTISTNTGTISTNTGSLATVTGDTSDAAITTNTTGTVSGKLRGIVAILNGRLPAALGATATAGSFPVSLPTDQAALPVTVGNTVTINQVISIITTTVTSSTVTGSYTTGDSVGTLMTFTNAMGGLTGKIKSLIISTTGTSTPFDLKVILFESDPTTATITDNAPIVIPQAMLSKIVGIVDVYSENFAIFDGSIATSVQIDYPVEAKTVYMALMAGATAPSFLGASSIVVTVGTNDF